MSFSLLTWGALFVTNESGVVDVFTANLRRYLAGETLLNRVNWELEY